MPFMKGDLLTKTRKLVKGLAKAEPVWYKAIAPPPSFPHADVIQRITLPEDVYVKKFFKKHPDSKHEDAIKISVFDPPPARIFGLRVLELKEQGVSEQEAMTVADAGKKVKKQAYVKLKYIARQLGKRPPPNPYPSALKEIQAEEEKHVYGHFHNPRIRQILRKLQEEKAAEDHDRMRGGWGGGGNNGSGRAPAGSLGSVGGWGSSGCVGGGGIGRGGWGGWGGGCSGGEGNF